MTKAVSADYSLGQAELAIALRQLIEANQPAMIWGPPGIGKSALATQVTDDLQMIYIDVRTLLLDSVDIHGLPLVQDGCTCWAPPSFLPPTDSTENFLINLEELPSAPPMVQAALYQLVLDRRIGEYRLPPGARLIACGNRETDRGVVHKMPTPLASRFIHIDAECDVDAWMDWALQANLAVEVIFFMRFRPELLMQFNPKSSGEKAFPCPRTWEFVSRMVQAGNTGSTAVDLAILRGAIGEGAAVEFAAFLEVFKQLPTPDAVFNDPLGVEIPEDPSAVIALCGALCRKAEDHRMDALVAFAKRDDFRPELGAFLIDSSVKFHPASRYTKAFVEWESHLNKI